MAFSIGTRFNVNSHEWVHLAIVPFLSGRWAEEGDVGREYAWNVVGRDVGFRRKEKMLGCRVERNGFNVIPFETERLNANLQRRTLYLENEEDILWN
ncbi:hypothetical protein [Desulfosporosinus shakirovi]|uniref:hypothetical protein n=1 Tax=Desulfosporosinus shakirovi TaxID=2885154 RepID=UPI001E3E53FB|nr:hypothetical protein [Desulfosporosinus sp. SRJS8]MCB8815062.1 hypothetical protein [Desulfosporosinus sp. SRJS8]